MAKLYICGAFAWRLLPGNKISPFCFANKWVFGGRAQRFPIVRLLHPNQDFCFLWKSPVFSWAASRQALVISLQIACSFRLKMTLLDISDKLTAGVFPGGPFVLWFVTNRVAAPSQDPQQDGHGLQRWTADETLINVITRCGIWIKKCSVLIQQITSCARSEFKDILLVYGKNRKWSAYA